MKKYFLFALLLTLAACSQPAKVEIQADSPEQEIQSSSVQQAQTDKWVEGTHYIVLDQPITERPTIYEFFSFWCPHCHKFEPVVAQLKQALPSEVAFSKVHVDFLGMASTEMQQRASTVMIVARHLGKAEEVNKAFFEHIHVKKLGLDTPQAIVAILADYQISADDLNTALGNPEVSKKVEEHYKTFLQFRPDLTGVPTFIVNGKYRAEFTRTMTIEDMIELLIWLSQKSS
jgi:thiol:disulfide interchange protein DsbA